MLTTGIKSFFNYVEPLNENVQGAKEYLLKRGAEKLKKEKRQLTDNEQKAILSDPDWIMVREITQRNPGYALTFLRFAKEQKAPKDILETTLSEIIKNKDRIKDLPIEIAKYADHKKSKDDQRPGYEVLIDDLMSVERKGKLKKLYNALQSKMKSAFEKATEEQIKELTDISNELDGLKPKDGKDPWQTFQKTLGRYENDKGYYPQFNNITLAFKTMVEEARDFVDNWKIDEDEYIQKLMSLKPQIDILYFKDRILALSTRTPDAQREVQGVLSWCLKYDSHFWSYVSGERVQLVISDGNRPSNDPMRMIGVTVESNGSIHAAYDANNHSIKNKNGREYKKLTDLLEDNDYPESLIKTLDRKIPDESKIKKALMLFYRKEESKNALDIIRGLLNLNAGFMRGQISPEDWEKMSADVSQIIYEVRGLRKEEFMKEFKKSGIFTESAWSIWDRLIGDDYTPEDMEIIYNITKRNLNQMSDLLELYSERGAKNFQEISPSSIESMKNLVSNRNQIIKDVEKRMK